MTRDEKGKNVLLSCDIKIFLSANFSHETHLEKMNKDQNFYSI
jgi:hypothetical protein